MVFKKAAEVISNVVNHIEESQDLCGKNKTEQGNSSPAQQNRNKQQYQRAKEQLTNESRQFVTASKLFVKRYAYIKIKLINKIYSNSLII